MIKLAFMSSVCPDWTLGEVAGAMKEHGYTGFEPRVEWGHVCGIEADLPADRRRETRDLFASEGLEICCLATGVRMAEPDTSERARHIEDLRRYLDLAADLGCGLVRTFGGRRDRGAELPAVVDPTSPPATGRSSTRLGRPASPCCWRRTTTGPPPRRCGP